MACWQRATSLALFCALGACGETSRHPQATPTTAAVALTPPMLYNNTAPIPGNGALLIWSQFGAGSTISVEVRSMSVPATAIGGSVRELTPLGHYWVWTPSAIMTEGTYSVSISSDHLGGWSDTIEVTAPRTFGKPRLESNPIAELGEHNGDYACCLQEGARLDISCFSITFESFITLLPGVTTNESASALTQLLFEARELGAADATPRPDLYRSGLEPLYFDTQADEYCFELVVTELATGEQYTFPDLGQCAPHGDLPDFSSRPLNPEPSQLERHVCPAPPAGFEEQWCEVNGAACEGAPGAESCKHAGHVCHGELVPDTMTGGIGGLGGPPGIGGGSAGMIAGDGASAGFGSGDEESAGRQPPKKATHVKACSVSGERTAGLWAQLSMLGAALGLVRSARRRRERAR